MRQLQKPREPPHCKIPLSNISVAGSSALRELVMRNTLLMVPDGLLLIKSRSQLHPPGRFDLAPAGAHNTNGTGSRQKRG